MCRTIASLWILVLVLVVGVVAQEPTPPVINALNVNQLKLVQRNDFADLAQETDTSETALFESGWFALDGSASQIAIVTAAQDIWLINDAGERLFSINAPTNADGLNLRVIDAGFAPPSAGWPFIATYSDGQQLVVVVADATGSTTSMMATLAEMPVAQWIDCLEMNPDSCTLGLEVIDLTTDRTSVLQLPLPDLMGAEGTIQIDSDEWPRFTYVPETSGQAFVRIGRIEPPYVVTGTPDGAVNLWDLQSQEMLAQVQVENGPVVFGQLNAPASHLAWRAPDYDALYLLDFASGKNLHVADLNGAYAQFFLVSLKADVIFAVHLNDEPVIVAWSVASGERYELGEYGPCSREPDMARLSADGISLVVGCESGLEIWRVEEPAK